MVGSFKYFAYGSNLSRHRLALSSPSLTKFGIGKLQGFTLKFGLNSERWKGGAASIHESQNSDDYVWGLIWEIDQAHLSALDDQEGVARAIYRPIQVDVEMPDGEKIACRTYQLTDLGGTQPYADPSPQYHGLILESAIENAIPNAYIEKLKSIKTNGNTEITKVMKQVAEMQKKN